jgi:hypothetical protein
MSQVPIKVMRKSPMMRTHHTYHGAINTDASGSVTGGTTGAVGCIITPFAFLKTHFPY